MFTVAARNVNDALPTALALLAAEGVDRGSRNGGVRMFPKPVVTEYAFPCERVIFYPERDANPFFHFMEALWMIAGRNDVEFPARFVKRMREYSDDGRTFHGAYGYRWRYHFGFDQLVAIIETLRGNPEDRRCVLNMWDPRVDLARAGKDFPCNTSAVFAINVSGSLDMTVFNRSNDIVWGAYGANAVHFSMLQEFMAASIGVPVGTYWQISTNFHAYNDTLGQVKGIEADQECPYSLGEVSPHPMMSVEPKVWQRELQRFLEEGTDPSTRYTDPFFRDVAVPLLAAHHAYANLAGAERYTAALEELEECAASDWQRAAREWLERRYTKFKAAKKANDDGPNHES